jgi:hypothetical protein
MRLFQRRKEDFKCEKCGNKVIGSGYTNHCPKCLFSKHVDVNPGDRAANCGGLMEPVGIEQTHGYIIILHRCLKCKFERKNKTLPEDNFDKIIALTGSGSSAGRAVAS